LAIALLPLFQQTTPYYVFVESRAFALATTLLALSITLGLAGMVDLGVGVYVGVGAYIAARASMDAGVPVIITPLISAIIAGMLAKILSFAIARSRGHYFALATLAIGLIAYNLFIRVTPFTHGVDGIGNIPGVGKSFLLGPGGLSSHLLSYYWTLLCLCLTLTFVLRIRSGQFGRCLRALGDDEIAAADSGIDVYLYRSWAYTIAGSIAGFAGALYAHTVNYVEPSDFGFQASVSYLALAVLGGMGRPIGLIAAALGMIFLEEKLRELGNVRMLFLAVGILAIMLYRSKIEASKI
jgi:branched-chain amino acid transport system permease protein